MKYYITAIKYDQDKNYIAQVSLHEVVGTSVRVGVLTGKNAVISKINQGDEIHTAVWNYSKGKWKEEAKVIAVTIKGEQYLKTVADDTVRDNLGHLLPAGGHIA